MKKTLVMVVMGLVLLAASCDTKNIGSLPWPGRGPVPTLTAPAPGDTSGLFGNETSTWVVNWIGGQAPYTVAWDWGGGGTNVGAAAGTSPVSQDVTWANMSMLMTYAVVVTVTDSIGQFGTATVSQDVEATRNAFPTIDSMVITGNTLVVTVSDDDDDTVTVTVSNHTGMSADSASKVASATGTATFSFSADDMLAGASTTIDVSADDGNGGVTTDTSGTMTIDAFAPAADTLYALVQSSSAAVGDPVTVLIYTGATRTFQFMLGVGLVVPDDGAYVSGTFNVGAIGGEKEDADGVWADITTDGGFALGPDALIIPGKNPDDSLGTNNRFDFNISPLMIGTPVGDLDVASVTGALFNLQFEFSSAGTKVFDFQATNGVNRTYYQDSVPTIADDMWGTFVSGEVVIN